MITPFSGTPKFYIIYSNITKKGMYYGRNSQQIEIESLNDYFQELKEYFHKTLYDDFCTAAGKIYSVVKGYLTWSQRNE